VAGAAQTTLVPLGDPAGRDRWTVEHAGHRYAVFALPDQLVVTDDACPHNGGPLSEGRVVDGVVTCPWHWYSFDLRSGACRTAARHDLRRYPVTVLEGQPYVEVPVRTAAPSWAQILRAHARGDDTTG
jgi:nitrite reductase/ring-hydroxylating ferredoxin subunit